MLFNFKYTKFLIYMREFVLETRETEYTYPVDVFDTILGELLSTGLLNPLLCRLYVPNGRHWRGHQTICTLSNVRRKYWTNIIGNVPYQTDDISNVSLILNIELIKELINSGLFDRSQLLLIIEEKHFPELVKCLEFTTKEYISLLTKCTKLDFDDLINYSIKLCKEKRGAYQYPTILKQFINKSGCQTSDLEILFKKLKYQKGNKANIRQTILLEILKNKASKNLLKMMKTESGQAIVQIFSNHYIKLSITEDGWGSNTTLTFKEEDRNYIIEGKKFINDMEEQNTTFGKASKQLWSGRKIRNAKLIFESKKCI